MYKRNVTIVNDTGLHARPAADFVAKAGSFLSNVTIRKEGNPIIANAKSIVFVLSLGIKQGDVLEVTAEGSDEKEAVDSLVALVESAFGE
ncbi:HPr family phosphocarrier protein [Acholeplasma sp. OttesenSCG-928-E16]|nr:HPr family phosphocarrier protein [Acholeplasma sp. OttesenSCG-928-E16]